MQNIAAIENRFYESYVEYFHRAESTRRWSPYESIPWNDVRSDAPREVRDIAQAFFAVEAYVPDYTSKAMHLVRRSRGRHLFQCSWGYEESKHGTAIGLWLVRSGAMTERGLREYEDELLKGEYMLPYDDPLHVLTYTVFQEYATRLNYTRFRVYCEKIGYRDPALDRVFALLARDEAAHFGFFKKGLGIYLDYARDDALLAINRVVTEFQMPARNEIPRWVEHLEKAIIEADIFTARIYMKEVVAPALKALGVGKQELRSARRRAGEGEGDEATAAA